MGEQLIRTAGFLAVALAAKEAADTEAFRGGGPKRDWWALFLASVVAQGATPGRVQPLTAELIGIHGWAEVPPAEAVAVMVTLEAAGLEYGFKRCQNTATGRRYWVVWVERTAAALGEVRQVLLRAAGAGVTP